MTGQTPAASAAIIHALGAGPKLYVDAKIDGRGPYRCLIDTAFSHTAFDPKIDARSGASHRVNVETLSFAVDHPMTMNLQGAEPGPEIYCIIGAEFFDKYIVTIDYGRGTISAFDPTTYRRTAGSTAIALTTSNNRFFVPVSLTVGSHTVTHWERLDTESEETIADNFVDDASIVRESTLNNGHRSGQYDRIEIGPFAIEHVWGPSSTEHSIGTEILRRFVVTIDVPHRRLLFEPTARLYDPIPTPPPAW